MTNVSPLEYLINLKNKVRLLENSVVYGGCDVDVIFAYEMSVLVFGKCLTISRNVIIL